VGVFFIAGDHTSVQKELIDLLCLYHSVRCLTAQKLVLSEEEDYEDISATNVFSCVGTDLVSISLSAVSLLL